MCRAWSLKKTLNTFYGYPLTQQEEETSDTHLCLIQEIQKASSSILHEAEIIQENGAYYPRFLRMCLVLPTTSPSSRSQNKHKSLNLGTRCLTWELKAASTDSSKEYHCLRCILLDSVTTRETFPAIQSFFHSSSCLESHTGQGSQESSSPFISPCKMLPK